jgi:rhamnosyltransferase
MKLSIIIPTWKAGEQLHTLLQRLWDQSVQPWEIIVIDSSSPDNTVELAKSLKCIVEVIPKKEFNHATTRNKAAGLATGNVLVFLTQDVLPTDNDFLANLAEPIVSGKAQIAFARQIAYPGATPTEAFMRNFNYPSHSYTRTLQDLPKYGFKTYFISNAASAVDKAVFDSAGAFSPVILSEDTQLSMRLLQQGYTLAYQADAQVLHSHYYTLVQQFRRLFDTGVFHARSKELLKNAAPEGEGIRLAAALLRYLWPKKAFWIPYALAELAAKFIGFQLGKNESRLPNRIKKILSLQPEYWSKPD